MKPDRPLDELAARQYGVFSIAQARSVGMTSTMIETRVKNGAWVRLAPSVYALASAPPKWERQMAAALLNRPGAIVAGRSAAYLHEFIGFRPGRPVIMVGKTGNSRSSLAKVIRCQGFDTVRRVRIRGFEVTDSAETVLGIARDLSLDRLEAVVDNEIAAGRLLVDDLERVSRLRSGAPGVVKVRSIWDERRADAYEPPVNELERLLHRLLDRPGVAPYQKQAPFAFKRVRMTVDSYIPAWRLIVEADGRRWHTRKADIERDRRRDNEATAHGFAVLRFTYAMLTQEPANCFDTLMQTGAVRTAS
ncbi:MAG: type IV toxin-antitoxin system AbiEi family antitoxin domain-containing protein [Actinomycetota bacterium]|nr:type IV toxin-antitoxin system AbiEi family antitoxin domain-containing protein [Actinomycetota bacterium]